MSILINKSTRIKRTLFHMKEMTYQFALQTKYSSEYKTTLNTLLEKINTQGPLPGNPSFPNFPLPPSYPHSK